MRNGEQSGGCCGGTASAVLLLVVLVSTVACAPWHIGAEKNVTRNGIDFETFRELKKGSKLGILARDTVIHGWPCRKGFIVFRSDWRLEELQLCCEHQRNGITMPAATWVFPNREGNPGICMFPHDLEIQGLPCRGSKMGKSGYMTSFYDNGKLKHFFTREAVMVGGVPCKGSASCGISLHEDGQLKQCMLSRAGTIGGVAYPNDSVLCFDQAGTVVDCHRNQ